MILESLSTTRESFETATGWDLKPEGACRGDVCIPLPPTAVDGSDPDARVDVAVVAERMGLPVVHDAARQLLALGPWSGNRRTLASAEAPELVLPDLDGNAFHLSSLRGRKVLLLAWAPY